MDLQGRGKTVFIGVTVAFILASLLVALRVVSRFVILKRRGWDDYLIVLAWILAFGMSFAIDFGTWKGLGLHNNEIPTAWHAQLLAAEYAGIVLYNVALMTVKSSILVFFLGISRDTQRFLRIGSLITLAVVIVAGIVLTFITAFQCQPIQAAYNLAIQHAKCISIPTIYLASVPINVATDLAILVLPIPILTSMNIPWQQKLILVLTFLTGVFVTVVDVARIYYMQLAAISIGLPRLTHVSLTSGLELSYNISLALLWSALEVNVSIICACIPTLRPLIRLLASDKRSDHIQSNDDPTIPVAENPAPQATTMTTTTTTESINFVTTPRMNPELAAQLAQTSPQQSEYAVYFGFINMRRPSCMLDTRGSECVKYCAIVITLFFLWGCTLSLLTALNSIIPFVGIQNPYQLLGIPAANFFSTALSTIFSLWILRNYGFKASFAISLGIYSIGTLMFYPSGALKSYPGIIVCNLVVGFSQGMIRVSSTMFIALCGPPQYSESRLLLADGIATAANLLGTLLSQKVFFVHVSNDPSLIAVQWTYLAIALFAVLLALFIYYMPLPETSDSELQSQAERERLLRKPSKKLFGTLHVIYATWAIGVLTSVFLSGAGEALNVFLINLLTSVATVTGTSPSISIVDFWLTGAGIYVASEFMFAFLCLLIPPRILLLVAYTGVVICCSLIMGVDLPSVNDTMAVVFVFVIFEAPIFSITFAITLRGLGRWTKPAACLISAGNAIGALVFPFLMLAVMRARTPRYSFCVDIALYGAGTLFPLYLNLFPSARHQVDPVALAPRDYGQQHPNSTWHEGGPVADAGGGDAGEIAGEMMQIPGGA